MAKQRRERVDHEESGNQEKVPLGQVLLDNVYLLLALGVGVPLLLYTVWGIIDIIRVPHLIP